MTQHWHIKVKDGRREWGALATTRIAAREEQDIENEHGREAQIIDCSRDCFGSRRAEPA